MRAYSLIADLVQKYECTQSRRPESVDRSSGESLDSRRAFKALVEKLEDRHTLDLLVLPWSVKEILLDLVKESGLGSSSNTDMADGNTGARSHGELGDRWHNPNATKQTLPDPFSTTDRWAEGLPAGLDKDSFFQAFSTAGTRGRPEGAEERLIHSPQEVGEEEQLGQMATLGTKVKAGLHKDQEQEMEVSTGNKEFWLLLKFFTAMGYTEDVVKRVLAQTGLQEASQILDLVQQEQDRSDRAKQGICGAGDPKGQDSVNQRERNPPCETEHREEEGTASGGGEVMSGDGAIGGVGERDEDGEGKTRNFEGEGREEAAEPGQEEDFVLGVVKKAAASCGYAEQNVAKVYSMLPDRSTHQLLLELQREGGREMDALRDGPREMDDVVLAKDAAKGGTTDVETRGEIELLIPAEQRETDENGQVKAPNRNVSAAEPDLLTWNNLAQQLTASQYTPQPKLQHIPKSPTPQPFIQPEVKGPPMPIYPLDPPLPNFQSDQQQVQNVYWTNPSTSKSNHQDNAPNPKPQSSNSLKQTLKASAPLNFTVNDSSPTRPKERRGFASASSVVVTGEQRFLEGLQAPFDLKLTDKPGNPNLRTIIIDGSNVAMRWELQQRVEKLGFKLMCTIIWNAV